jgi:hypothetical protein
MLKFLNEVWVVCKCDQHYIIAIKLLFTLHLERWENGILEKYQIVSGMITGSGVPQ